MWYTPCIACTAYKRALASVVATSRILYAARETGRSVQIKDLLIIILLYYTKHLHTCAPHITIIILCRRRLSGPVIIILIHYIIIQSTLGNSNLADNSKFSIFQTNKIPLQIVITLMPVCIVKYVSHKLTMVHLYYGHYNV